MDTSNCDDFEVLSRVCAEFYNVFHTFNAKYFSQEEHYTQNPDTVQWQTQFHDTYGVDEYYGQGGHSSYVPNTMMNDLATSSHFGDGADQYDVPHEYLLQDLSVMDQGSQRQASGYPFEGPDGRQGIDASGIAIYSPRLGSRLPFTFAHMWPEMTILWPLYAAQSGLAQPPVEMQFRMLNGDILSYWLPRQHEFGSWDENDVDAFITLFESMGISIDWNTLDLYHTTTKYFESVQKGPCVQHTSTRESTSSSSRQNSENMESSLLEETSGGLQSQQSQEVVDPQVSVDNKEGVAPTHRQDSVNAEQLEAAQQVGNNTQNSEAGVALEEDQHKKDIGDAEPVNGVAESGRKETLLTAELAAELHDLVDVYDTVEAREKFLERHDLTWYPPQDDNTVPNSDDEVKVYVRQLLFAMTSTKDAQDSERSNSFASRWLPCKSGEPYYNKTEMVLQCWKLVTMAINLHRKGPSTLNCFDHNYAKQFKATKDWTFAMRINNIADLLATRKSRCDLVMRGESLDGFVGAPGKMANRSIQNNVSNGRKAKAIMRGMPLLKTEEKRAVSQSTSGTLAATSASSSTGSINPTSTDGQVQSSGGVAKAQNTGKTKQTTKGKAVSSQQASTPTAISPDASSQQDDISSQQPDSSSQKTATPSTPLPVPGIKRKRTTSADLTASGPQTKRTKMLPSKLKRAKLPIEQSGHITATPTAPASHEFSLIAQGSESAFQGYTPAKQPSACSPPATFMDTQLLAPTMHSPAPFSSSSHKRPAEDVFENTRSSKRIRAQVGGQETQSEVQEQTRSESPKKVPTTSRVTRSKP
ncbi:hypothetical protein C7974DRAFT_410169 [Boeremia exigua]|uniref:uncharacterized protein n=1 Tax=Boeremia exigua TaxID=749465 RepID=UPI001E8CDC32|nr:uncharacterized protein C7974DRAFT_410169 [Boeremia exigua]KAH6639185.1 hypothetical protein C7974DRAFT_410169 [Boeremia exigua]